MDLNKPVPSMDVFVFDDEAEFANDFATMLTRRGLRTHAATTKNDALRLVRNFSYEHYCVDVETPWDRQFGIDLIHNIREHSPDAYIEVISAHTKYRSRINEIGANGFVHKPIETVEYAQKLAQKKKREDRIDVFVNRTATILNENPEIKRLLVDVIGKQVPSVGSRTKKMIELKRASEKYLSDTGSILKMIAKARGK